VADGKLQEFAGDLDDYQQWLRSRGNAVPAAATPAGVAARAAPTQRSSKSTRRDPVAKLRQQLEQVEARIAAVSAERALAEAEFAASPLVPRLAMRRANLQRDAAYLESQWMEIGIAIEAAETAETERLDLSRPAT
jgi:ATP-binding cassette, subfamily F, member 3